MGLNQEGSCRTCQVYPLCEETLPGYVSKALCGRQTSDLAEQSEKRRVRSHAAYIWYLYGLGRLVRCYCMKSITSLWLSGLTDLSVPGGHTVRSTRRVLVERKPGRASFFFTHPPNPRGSIWA